MRTFFDLWYLSPAFAFDGPTRAAAVNATFTRRGALFPTHGLPEALTSAFSDDPAKQSQWERFASKIGGQPAPALEALLRDLRAFLKERRPLSRAWLPYLRNRTPDVAGLRRFLRTRSNDCRR